MRKVNQDSFWITNITKKSVHLDDIGVVINSFTSLNLLDKKHSDLTRPQLEISLASGSLKRRSNMVVVRRVPPAGAPTAFIPWKEDAVFDSKHRSAVELEDIKYEELDVSDDDYANENAEMAEQDHSGKFKKL